MNKIYKFNKYLYVFIFSIISIAVFIIDFSPYNILFSESESAFLNFLTELEGSLNKFDIIYVTLWLFIVYFYFNVYFDGKKYSKRNIFCTIISIIFTIITILGKSYSISNSLNSLYSSSAQIFKTVVFSFGYYLIYYAFLKKIFNFKINLNLLKKKDL